MSNPEISSTTAYDIFSALKGNRDVKPAKVASLVKAIKERNLLDVNPITVNEKYEVIDGQHRLAAAKVLGLAIYYIVKPGLTLKDVQRLNANRDNWNTENYLKSHIERGNENYKILYDFCKEFGLSPSVSVILLTHVNNGLRAGVIGDKFKDGKLIITDIKGARETAMQLMDFVPYVEKNVQKSRYFIKAMRYLYDNDLVTHKELVKRLKAYHHKGKTFISKYTMQDYVRQFEDAYNLGKHDKVRF